jgi:DNA invertase Pin-like site-specific DNA recombinase
MQVTALKAAGCSRVYEEKLSGAKKKRPELELAIKDLRPGDTFVVWRLDRLSRSMRDLYQRLSEIEEAGALFRSLEDRVDFSTANGKFMLGVLASVSEFERQVTGERTRAGIKAMQERGKKFGAVIKFTEDKKRTAIKMQKARERRMVRGKMVWRDKYKIKQIAKALGVSVQTLHAHEAVIR